jgi:hypothetical protein
MEEEIKLLRPTLCDCVQVSHNLVMTMIDRKVCTYLSEAHSSALYYLCLAKPSHMNNLDTVLKKEVATEILSLVCQLCTPKLTQWSAFYILRIGKTTRFGL